MSFLKRLDKINVIVSIIGIVMSSLFSYFSFQDYKDLKYIRENGKEVVVKVISKNSANGVNSIDVLFEGKTYYVRGRYEGYKKGKYTKLTYSKEKDKFLYGYKDSYYSYIFMFLGMIFICIVNLFMAFFKAWKPFSKS